MDRDNRSSNDMVLENETPMFKGTQRATGEELRAPLNRAACNDAAEPDPQGSPAAESIRLERRSTSFAKTHTIGAWNVRSMGLGKLDIVKAEMDRTNIEILGISELKWTGMGYFQTDDYTVYYSGNDTGRRNGVALILHKNIAKSVLGYTPVNDRIITIRLQGHPINVTIIQVYVPTTEAEEEDIDTFYEQLQQVIDSTAKGDIMSIIRDMNAKVG